MQSTTRANGPVPLPPTCARLPDPRPVLDWLACEAPRLDGNALVSTFAERLILEGLPVDRLTVDVGSGHSTHAGFARFWQRDGNVRRHSLAYEERESDLFQRSPFHHVYRTGAPLSLDLKSTPDDAFGIVPELKAAGLRHYECHPLPFADGRDNAIALATAQPEGFGTDGSSLLRSILPTFKLVLELDVERWRLRTTLRTYVGCTPAARILSGDVRREEVGRIQAALMFADMRDFSRLTADQDPTCTVALLDAYFDCLVPAIHTNGGEVLKYMGDGLLASFAVDETSPDPRALPGNALVGNSCSVVGAVHGALASARQGLACLDALNRTGRSAFAIRAGFALHFGEAAYGNVGSQDRLDFTVVGRDVNLASRIGRLNRVLSEPILMSDAFAERLVIPTRDAGVHAVAGLRDPVRVHAPG